MRGMMHHMESKRVKAVAYYRISTLLGQSVENQSVPIREYLERRGVSLVCEYSDEGVSGAKERRPALDRLVRDARAKKFDVLVVTALDRLGRNVKHLLTLLDELDSLGVTFVSLREGLDAGTAQGRMIMTVLGAFAEMERQLIRTRIKESLAAKKLLATKTANGWRCGRPPVVNPEIVKHVLELRADGLSFRAIEMRLNKRVSRATVERIVKANEPAPGHRHKTLDEISSKCDVISMPESRQDDTADGDTKRVDFVASVAAKGSKR